MSIQVDNETRSPHLRDLTFEDNNVLRAGEGTGLPLSESSEVAGRGEGGGGGETWDDSSR